MAGFGLIKIFTDTNVLHAAQAHLLVATKVAEYIAEHKRIESVELKWLMPRMVMEERRHQMVQAALSLVPKIEDLERLLGHSLAITQEVMEDRIDSKIRRALDEYGIEIVDLDLEKVSWQNVIDRSVRRHPPFEYSGDKEKGFRDAVIAETFLQEVSKSPATPRSCLLVLVSGDQRLREFVLERSSSAKNVRVLDSLDELKSLLNAISSEITEEFLGEITPIAKSTFWDFEGKDGLYSRAEVYKKITEEYGGVIESVTEKFPGTKRKQTAITLGEQTFIKKSGQTVVWSRIVIIKSDLTKPILPNLEAFLNAASGSLKIEDNIFQRVESSFAVEWQHQITTKGQVSKPKINKIEFIGNSYSPSEKA